MGTKGARQEGSRKGGGLIVDKLAYSLTETAQVLGVSRPTVYALLKRNEFRWFQIGGGKYRISKKSFDEWLDNQ